MGRRDPAADGRWNDEISRHLSGAGRLALRAGDGHRGGSGNPVVYPDDPAAAGLERGVPGSQAGAQRRGCGVRRSATGERLDLESSRRQGRVHRRPERSADREPRLAGILPAAQAGGDPDQPLLRPGQSRLPAQDRRVPTGHLVGHGPAGGAHARVGTRLLQSHRLLRRPVDPGHVLDLSRLLHGARGPADLSAHRRRLAGRQSVHHPDKSRRSLLGLHRGQLEFRRPDPTRPGVGALARVRRQPRAPARSHRQRP